MMKTKKIDWLLVLQGWAMLWVVIGHAGPANTVEEFPTWAKLVYDFAYSFHMPLFIAVSGFLFYLTRINKQHWTFFRMLEDKLYRFGIPFLFFTLFAMVLKTIFSSLVVRPSSISIGELVHSILYPSEGPMCEFWFLAVIMWMFILMPFWKIAIRNKITIFITSIISISLYFIIPTIEFLALSRTAHFCSYFWWGILAARLYSSFVSQNNKTILENLYFSQFRYLFLCNTISIILYYFVVKLKVLYLPAIFGILLSLFTCLILYKIQPKIFRSFRNYTYQIYLMGLFAQEFVKVIRYKFDLPFMPLFIVSIIAGLFIPVLITLVIKKIDFKMLHLCIGLKF